jgi:hypothetical protein
MAEQLAARVAVDSNGAPALDVDLGALAVELGLSDVAGVSEQRRIGEAAGEHGRDEGHRFLGYQAEQSGDGEGRGTAAMSPGCGRV